MPGPHSSPSLFTARTAAGLAGAALAACAPALDWREARLEGPGLQALFPCRPVAQTREVALAGSPRPVRLHACEAAGRTYAVMLADVAEPAAVGPALLALREASTAKAPAGAATPAPGWPLPAGATPQPAAGRWQLALPGGRLRMDTAVFARGTWVVQASVIGAAEPASASAPTLAVAPFFEALRFAP